MKDLEDGLKGLRVDETGYLIVPHGVEINPLGSGGKIWPVRQIIQQWQHLIRQRMFTDFIAMGSGSSGSRALAAELTSMFALSLRINTEQNARRLESTTYSVDIRNKRRRQATQKISSARMAEARQ